MVDGQRGRSRGRGRGHPFWFHTAPHPTLSPLIYTDQVPAPEGPESHRPTQLPDTTVEGYQVHLGACRKGTSGKQTHRPTDRPP